MSTDNLNYYKLLEIEPNSSTEEIVKAYKNKAKEYHPDKNNNSPTATKLFQFINDAKDTLTNKVKRLEYDYKEGIKIRPENSNKNKKKNRRNLIVVGVLTFLAGFLIRNK